MLEQSRYFQDWFDMVQIKGTTRNNYVSYLKHFDTFLLESGFTEDEELDFEHFFVDGKGRYWPINKDFVVDFVNWLEEHTKGDPTAATNAFQALRSFFRTLASTGRIAKDPTEGVAGPRYHRSRKNERLAVDEAKRVLAVAEKMDPFWKRPLTLTMLLLLCGLRGGEVRALCLDQIDFDDRMIRIDRGQRKGPGTIAMSTLVFETLKHYVFHPMFKQLIKCSNEPILRNQYGEPLSYYDLKKEVQSIIELAGINRNIPPHVLRHSFASLANEAGLCIEEIRQQLRHENVATTIGYINPDEKTDREIINQSPMANMIKRLRIKKDTQWK